MSKKLLMLEKVRLHYKALICIIILVFVINEIAIYRTYKDQINTADIINQAGRQRMYSQKISKLTLQYLNDDEFARKELEKTVSSWRSVHKSFSDVNSTLSKFYYSSKPIQENFDELDKFMQDIDFAVNQILTEPELDDSEYVNIIMENEAQFLSLMDTIVNQIEEKAEQSFYKATIITFVIGTITIIGIILIILVIMWIVVENLVNKETLLTIALDEKEALLIETHHRVKNNLAIVSGMLQLQLINNEFNKKTFENAIDRVQSIASIHEFLYHEKEYSLVNIDQYINEFITKLSCSYPQLRNKIRVHVVSDTIQFDMENAVPFSLLLNELITNSLKHAFREGDSGQIDVTLVKNGTDEVLFKYNDNGKGVLDLPNNNTGIGMQLIETFAQQLNCTLDISYSPSFMLISTFKL